ncbi:hypothetical protein ELH75_37015 [Rhizobium leguminosarum]|uniref:Lipoprotein n=1 Tax=Rhizobium leguminosarum TaxID=384 RepID=A0A4Q8XNK3_RHILE|nr:hypothetical protein [Rhizobium leguminosarum]MBY2994962.1 hypothetical protein [Rhizobium leguminosarum]MBY3059733.1 hypothetical protein [Rhizobium leguminosarum]TAV41612.1 hypothetical protein ELI29_33945 [Rhizobium leguminosarum]TAX02039.1 hypothetical protein ELI07_33220 [Rhizobium leguminosarum]TAX22833.1 hypothetical protein ELI04_33120 [Rhizobium leguminosarum]
MIVRNQISIALAVLLMLSFGAFAPAVAQEKLVAPETNPPGDIPDNQVFVTYTSPDGFDLKVPEGWSRTVIDHGVRFFDKYDQIDATLGTASAAPTASSAKAHEITDLKTAAHAVKVTAVKDVKLAAGPAIRISYQSNSAPNPVTNKQIRLDHERFILFKNGKTVTLDLAAPAGADNVDQWQLISNSLQWR